MDIFALVDARNQQKKLFVYKCYLLYVGKQQKKINREIVPLISSLCSVVTFLQIKLFYNDLFSVLHYL